MLIKWIVVITWHNSPIKLGSILVNLRSKIWIVIIIVEIKWIVIIALEK